MAKQTMMDPNDLIIVGLDTDEGEDHALYDERIELPISEALVASIITRGVQQPVHVRRDGGKYYVVDGRQRVVNAREARKRQAAAGEYEVEVPIIEVEGDDVDVAGLGIALNELRQDDDMLTKAKKAARLMNMNGGNVDDVAREFGKTAVTIQNWLRVAKAEPKIHEAVRSKQITNSMAVDLARLEREEQLVQLDLLLKGAETGAITSTKVKKAVAAAKGSTSAATSPLASGAKPKAGAAAPAATTKQSRDQSGVKRVWVREALETERAKKLTEEQIGVLRWFSTGVSDKGTWYDDFMFEASAEMEAAKAAKAAKPKEPKAPKVRAASVKPKGKPGRKPKADSAPATEKAAKAPKAAKAAKAEKEAKAAKAPKAAKEAQPKATKPKDEIDAALAPKRGRGRPAAAKAAPAEA